jgi:hypothetical protein
MRCEWGASRPRLPAVSEGEGSVERRFDAFFLPTS